MTTNKTGSENDRNFLVENNLSRLLKSAMDVKAQPLSQDQIRWLVRQAVITHEPPHKSPAPAFPLWTIIASEACFVVLAVVGYLLPYEWLILKTLSIIIPAANLVLSPLAALAIVRRRRSSYAQ